MEVILQKVDRTLSKTGISLGNYVLNPYKGCTLGCTYCYVQYNKGIKKAGKEWGEFVFIKENFIELFKKELKNTTDISRVLIGSTTEAFQEIEKDFYTTLEMLKLLKENNIPFVLLTKQPYIADYIDLINYSEKNLIYLTVNSEIIRTLFEKRSKPIINRIEAIKKLYLNNIDVIAYIGPFFPELTDINELFESLKDKVKKVYIEAYHPKMGNFFAIREILKDKPEIVDILINKEKYETYWEEKKNEIEELNKNYGFILKFFITNYESYY